MPTGSAHSVLGQRTVALPGVTVDILTIDGDGGYMLQSYARTLTGLGMELTFTRKVDGEDLRVVKARLVKDAD